MKWGRALEIIKIRSAWAPKMQDPDTEPKPVLTLREIIRFAAVQDCKMNAGKIYGFLSLLDTTRFSISVDYRKSNKDLFTETILRFIDFVDDCQWTCPRSLLDQFGSGRKDLALALGIDENDSDCRAVVRLMLQLKQIPLQGMSWQRTT